MKVERVPFDHPDAVRLRDLMVNEVAALYGGQRDRGPGGAGGDGSFGIDPLDVVGTALVREGAAPIGHVTVRRLGDDLEIKRMYVAEHVRGRGVAELLIAAAEAIASEHGAGRLVLHTGERQLAAVAVYRRHGYTPIDVYEPYIDLPESLCFEKVLRLEVAAAQVESVAGDVETNVAAAVEAVQAAAGVRVLVLPELVLTGYAMPPTSIRPDDPRLEPLERAATEAGQVVIAGAAIAGGPGERPTIGLLAFGADERHVYDKQHLSGIEQDHFRPGDAGAILVVDQWRLGLAVCYDGCFPEHARTAADAGAEAYLASIAYYAGSEHRRDLYHRARALDNGFFVVMSGLAGECDGDEFCGGAAVFDPEGRPLAEVAAHTPGLAVARATLDRALIGLTRTRHPMLAERRSLGPVRVIPPSE